MPSDICSKAAPLTVAPGNSPARSRRVALSLSIENATAWQRMRPARAASTVTPLKFVSVMSSWFATGIEGAGPQVRLNSVEGSGPQAGGLPGVEHWRCPAVLGGAPTAEAEIKAAIV